MVGRFRDVATGRLIREEPIRHALDTVIDAQAVQMRALTQSLLDGQLSLAAWQSQMMFSLKQVHIVGTTLANGGWAQMDQSTWGWVGQRIRTQYAFLRDFAADLAAGRQPLNGTAVARSALYAQAGRATHREAQRRAAKQRDLERERRILGAADHCRSCLSEAARGWQPLGSLRAIGDSECRSACRCHFEFKLAAA